MPCLDVPGPEKKCGVFYWSSVRDVNDKIIAHGREGLQLDMQLGIMICVGSFSWEEFVQYARKWVEGTGKYCPTIDARCFVLNECPHSSFVVIETMRKFEPECVMSHKMVLGLNKGGMEEYCEIDIFEMSNYDFAIFRCLCRSEGYWPVSRKAIGGA